MKVLGMILSGGEGTRLQPLTRDRAKPAVPFGGNYRIIDFVLSNFVNSDIFTIYLITQFRSHSLMGHIRLGWRASLFDRAFIETVPPQMRDGKRWYEGTADAIYQNMNLISDQRPDHICIFGGDHIYKMDIRQMMNFHIKRNAALTIAAVPVPIDQCSQFGIIEVDENWRMTGFREKPSIAEVKPLPDNPNVVMASMGNYIFETKVLIDALNLDRGTEGSSHDFGKDIIPAMFPKEPVYVYDFRQNIIPGDTDNNRGYWRDVGTLASYMSANMDLIETQPQLNLYNEDWPIRSYTPPLPAAKFVHDEPFRRGHAVDSMICSGSIISGSFIKSSLVGPLSKIHSHSELVSSVMLGYSSIDNHCRIKNTIIDKGVYISPNTTIGYDIEQDRKLPGCHVSEEGIVVIPKGVKL